MVTRLIIAVAAGVVLAAATGVWLEVATFDWALWLTYRHFDDWSVNYPALILKAAFMGVLPASMSVVTYAALANRHQRKTGLTRCGQCGYTLKGLTEPRCPECGCVTKA